MTVLPRLGERDRRALKLLVLVLAAAVLWWWWDTLPIFRGRTEQVSIEALEQRYLLARERAQRLPLRERNLRFLEESLDGIETRMLSSPTSALAQAEMRSLVTRLLRAEGIVPQQTSFGRVVSSSNAYIGIPLALDFVCVSEQFVNFLASLANASTILATRNLEISLHHSQTKDLRVRVMVEGYLPSSRVQQSAVGDSASGEGP